MSREDPYLIEEKIPSYASKSPYKTKLYIEECKKQIDAQQKKINEKVNDWYTFSTTPQTEEDIRTRLMKEIKEKSPGKYVCMTYICKYSTLSEDFIEEIINLTKTKFRKSYFSIDGKKPTDRNSYYEYASRVDWKNICRYQKLSEEFIERHKNDVLWNYIYQFQDLSEEFKKEHKRDYEETSLIFEDSDESENIH